MNTVITDNSEMVISIKKDLVVTTFTQCPFHLVIDSLFYHKMEVFNRIMVLKKYNSIVSEDCFNVFKLISEEVLYLNEKFFSPNFMSIAISSEFDLNEKAMIIYKVYNLNGFLYIEYQQDL